MTLFGASESKELLIAPLLFLPHIRFDKQMQIGEAPIDPDVSKRHP